MPLYLNHFADKCVNVYVAPMRGTHANAAHDAHNGLTPITYVIYSSHYGYYRYN